jgi:ABC-type nitrate/sulfonate/bicarbonate transport system substrate-binding protein
MAAASAFPASEVVGVNKQEKHEGGKLLGHSVRLGFLPLNDAAPLIMAHELGLFRKYGVRVTLHRELGWASIRDKIIYRELDGAHALAAMPIAATLGFGSIACECVTALVLNLNGNAITLSEQLWRNDVRNGLALSALIRRSRTENLLTFGVVHQFSSHRYLLAKWLSSLGINPAKDIRTVVLPPSQMVANLGGGNLDGFCVGEPWNSVAIAAAKGWCAETSLGIDPGHPEKVFMVREDFAETRSSEHLAILAALLESCEFCDEPENADLLARTLSASEYIGTDADTLSRSSGNFDMGHGESKRFSNFLIFNKGGANEPDNLKAAWVLEMMRGAVAPGQLISLKHALAERVYRSDIFSEAKQLFNSAKQNRSNEKKEQLAA